MLRLVLAAALALVAAGPAYGAGRRAEDEIRAARASYNAAIAAHDFAAMRGFYTPDYTLLPGSSGAAFDLDAYARRFATTLADPTWVTYVRTPTRIAIGGTARRAAESGVWVGTWRKPDGLMRLTGVYQAMWVPTPQGWRLKNESFVSLHCTGSRSCAEVD